MALVNKLEKKNDIQLWELIVEDDKAAFEVLYRRYYSPLMTFALQLQFDEDTAMDCIQDLFFKLFVNKKNVRILPYVKAFLYRSLRNALFDKWKSRRNDTVSEEELVNVPVEDEYMEKLFRHNDEDVLMGQRLMAAYHLLNERQQTALSYRFIQEFSWEEMAVALDMSPHSCMNLVGRSIVKLRMLLAGNGMSEIPQRK